MTTIYHNPRCSKSRQTLKLLEEQGIEPNVVLYLEQPPTASEVANLCAMLGVAPLSIIRKTEATFKELGLGTKDTRTDQQWCQIISDNPILLERPIVVRDNQARIGRPPEDVLTLFS